MSSTSVIDFLGTDQSFKTFMTLAISSGPDPPSPASARRGVRTATVGQPRFRFGAAILTMVVGAARITQLRLLSRRQRH